jgi:predicted GIY-YIG superfamily endonuclease
MKPFWVYILLCADGSYYTGHTDNLEHRLGQHQAGECGGYTATRRPIKLVWSQECVTREEALSAELRIKGWSRKKKEAMMRGDWDEVSRLAKSKSAGSTRTNLHPPTAVRPELVVRQAHHGRDGTPTVRPELVEGREADE